MSYLYDQSTFEGFDKLADESAKVLKKQNDNFVLNSKEVKKINGHDSVCIIGKTSLNNQDCYLYLNIFAENGMAYQFMFYNREQDESYNSIYDDILHTIVINPIYKPTTEASTSTETNKESSDEISDDFKEACDAYERFIDEYVEFMNTYSETDDTSQKLHIIPKFS